MKRAPKVSLRGGVIRIIPEREKPKGPLIGYQPKSPCAAARKHVSRPKPLTTIGHMRHSVAFVYVGISEANLIKIGMSADPERRCNKDLGIRLLFQKPVTPSAAKLVETMALRSLGAVVGDGEWIETTSKRAIEAVKEAWLQASFVAHVDPSITENQARLERIARCLPKTA